MNATIASLCSGYGGAEMALTLAGWQHELAFVADPDPAASKLLAHHHPNVPNLGDITTVDWSRLERVDILTAGFPCTDISSAGRRAGLGEGTRSGVWSHVATAIDVLRPRLALLENVAALLSTPANRSTNGTDGDVEPGTAGLGNGPDRSVLRAIGAVLGDLSVIGYDAVWQVVSAASVGAPHLRKRVFILAWPAADPPRLGHRDAGPEGVGGIPAAAVAGGAQAGELILLRTPRATRGGSTTENAALLPTPRTTDSNGAGEHGTGGIDLRTAVSLLPTPMAADGGLDRGSSAGFGLRNVSRQIADRWGGYAPAIARWESVTGRPAPEPTEPGRNGQPRLSPRFVEWLMGLPGGYVTDLVGRNDALRLLGNGIVPLQGASAVTELAAIVARLFASEVAA